MAKFSMVNDFTVANLKKSEWTTAPALITTLSNHNGYDYRTAICELFDNGLAANANKIECFIYKNDEGKTVFMLTDNGDGMSESEIVNHFIKLGNSSNKENVKSSSFFGIGGKTGIEYLSKKGGDIQIITHKENNPSCILKWSQGSMPEYGTIDNDMPIGTTIIVNDSILDADVDAGELIPFLGLIYYPSLSTRKELVFRVNKNIVKPIDPLYRNILSDKHYHFDNAIVDNKNVNVTFIHFDNDMPLKETQINAYDKKVVGKTKKGHFLSSLKTSGMYFVYGGRYITIGGNTDLLGKVIHSSYNGSRAEVVLDKDMAELLCIGWNKTSMTKRLDKIEEASNLLETLLRLFNIYAKAVTTKIKKEPKYIKNVMFEVNKMSTNEINYDLTVENRDTDMPMLTFNIEAYKGRKNGKKTGVFNINPLSRRYPQSDSKVKELYVKLNMVCPILCEVHKKYRDESVVKDIIEKFILSI